MPADAHQPGQGFSAFEQLTAWAVPRLRALIGDEAMRAHADTLNRLLDDGGFKDLPQIEREKRVEEIIQVSSTAAVGMASLPLPFLDLPVLVGMVGAIGKVHGLDMTDRQLYSQVLATIGGGIMLRQLLRAIPFGGTLYAAQIYGATWALGRVAQTYCTTKTLPNPDDLQRLFEETLARKSAEHKARQEAAVTAALNRTPVPAGAQPGASTAKLAAPGDASRRMKELQALKDQQLITEDEYRAKRDQSLAGV
jgi:uncharacterized protein (DUF697 family)